MTVVTRATKANTDLDMPIEQRCHECGGLITTNMLLDYKHKPWPERHEEMRRLQRAHNKRVHGVIDDA